MTGGDTNHYTTEDLTDFDNFNHINLTEQYTKKAFALSSRLLIDIKEMELLRFAAETTKF